MSTFAKTGYDWNFQVGNVQVKGQTFGEITGVVEGKLDNITYDGIVGMNPTDKITSLLKTMVAQHLLADPVFSVYLSECVINASNPE